MLQRIAHAGRALQSRDLRIYFAGQSISLLGRMMQSVAMSWLVYRLTGSTVLLGLIATTTQLPSIVMAPLAGAIADRWSRFRMVWWAQFALLVQATILSVLVLVGVVEVWHLLVLAFFMGVAVGVDIPSRQALLVRLVADPDDLPNAIALNSSMFNAARLIGPALGGFAVAAVGEGAVFLFNALTYIPVLVGLSMIRPTETIEKITRSVMGSVLDGFAYARGFRPVRIVLLFLGGMSLLAIPYFVLLPAFAEDVFGGDARTLGLMLSCSGGGALVGALYLASRDTVVGLGRVASRSTGVCGLGLIAVGASNSLLLTCVLLVPIGFGVIVTSASVNTILQTLVDEEMRARVMSLFTVAFLGSSAIGASLGGIVADLWGVRLTVALGGLASIALATWLYTQLPSLRRQVYPIYAKMGILPELAVGMDRASELRARG